MCMPRQGKGALLYLFHALRQIVVLAVIMVRLNDQEVLFAIFEVVGSGFATPAEAERMVRSGFATQRTSAASACGGSAVLAKITVV